MAIGILALPDDVLFIILSHLSVAEIGRVSQTCRKLRHLAGQDAAWHTLSQRLVNVHDSNAANGQHSYKTGRRTVNLKDKCRISLNWSEGRKKDVSLLRFQTRYNPWLQLEGELLYVSQGETVHCFRLSDRGRLHKKPLISFTYRPGDVSRFVLSDADLLTGGSDGRVLRYNKQTGTLLACYRPPHPLPSAIIGCVDMTREVVLGGLADRSIVLWNAQSGQCLATIPLLDRIWSLSASPCQRSFASGNAGTAGDRQPIKIWDIETANQVLAVGRNWKHGAGTLDMQYETSSVLLSCGHDTAVRQWDLRTPCLSPVLELEDPHDYTVYCLQSDGKHLIASGTALWSVVRLWDKRMARSLKSFFVDKSNNPVYSLQFNGSHMYLALGMSVKALNFAGS